MRSRRFKLRVAFVLALVVSMMLAAFFVATPTARANHDTVPWSWNQSVAVGVSLDNYSAAALNDGRGNLYDFYLYLGPAGATNIYVRKYTDAGSLGYPRAVPGFPVVVNNPLNVVDYNTFVFTYFASAAIDHSGNIYVAWTRTASGPGQNDVYVSRSADGGLTWSLNNIRVNNFGAVTPRANEYDYAASIAAAPNGTVYVAWVQQMGSWYNVTVSYSLDSGNTWSAQQNVTERPTAGGAVAWPRVAVDSQNRVYVVYDRGTAARYLVNYTWSDNGRTWAAPVNLNGGTTTSGYAPTLVVDSADRVHVAWMDTRESPSGNWLIFYTRSGNRGSSWMTPVPISQGNVFPYIFTAELHFATKGDTLMAIWDNFDSTESYAVSADNGNSWYGEQVKDFGVSTHWVNLAVDQNGTYYALVSAEYSNLRVYQSWWHSPPSKPVITSVTTGTGTAAVTWTAPPEADIASYRVWRSNDGASYSLVAVVNAPTTSYADAGLANGTYWYRIEAVDDWGYVSHESMTMFGTVGPTVSQLNAEINTLHSQITSLQGQLANAQANISVLQTQLTNAQNSINTLQSQLTALQNSANANQAANAAALTSLQNQLTSLQGTVTNLQNSLNQARAEQATQTISYVNMGFEILVVVLLALILVMQMRKPKTPMSMGSMQPEKPREEL